jgi:hypothetical protein
MAAGQTLTLGFNGLVVCYCVVWPAGLQICCNAWWIKVNVVVIIHTLKFFQDQEFFVVRKRFHCIQNVHDDRQ